MAGSAGRPKAYPVKKLVALSNSMMDRISDWHSRQADGPNESEAIRRLLQYALDQLETPHTLFRRCLKASKEGAGVKEIRNTILDDHPLVKSIMTDENGMTVQLTEENDYLMGRYRKQIRYISMNNHWTMEDVKVPGQDKDNKDLF